MRNLFLALLAAIVPMGIAAAESKLSPADEAAILKVEEDVGVAWQKGDIDAILALCTSDVTYVNGVGRWWRSQEEMRRGWTQARTGGAIPKTVERHIQLLGPALAYVTTRSIVTLESDPSKPMGEGLNTTVLRKEQGRWKVAFGQTTLVAPQGPRP